MISTIIIFFLTLAIAIAMIARKIWKLRKGQIVAGSYEEADWTELSVEAVRNRFLEIMKFSVHHFILVMLKVWIITSNWVKQMDSSVKNRLMHKLHKNAQHPAGAKPSRFLKHIREHKDAVVSAIQKERQVEEGG
jgi:nitrate reductase gamma subunit